ncbi:MAG: thiamine pyrophosphate-binding protein [Candidatus Hydrogenedentes bacterium]|nr:thiamine pyrophosphate-binding protein [Candidatus Hydrogenedentota bacterium]
MSMTVGGYLVRCLEEAGLKHVFGVPGDYVLGFYDMLYRSHLKVIGTCNEMNAGYAADAYARLNGLGAVCVTYCVGGLSVLNAVAQAYAEESPLIVISGSPGLNERVRSPFLHHRVKDFDTQLKVFREVTVCTEVIEDAANAPAQIHRAIAMCRRYKRPVYIELPRDVPSLPMKTAACAKDETIVSDAKSLHEALQEASSMLRAAKSPVILAGVEMHRFGLQRLLVQLVERTGFPIAATLLGKSVISERHPQFIGIYEGGMGHERVTRKVESADCVLSLGEFMTDINLGIGTAKLDTNRIINATSARISIRYHHYEEVLLRDFMEGLLKSRLGPRRKVAPLRQPEHRAFRSQPARPICVRRFWARVNECLDENTIVICDVGDSLFGGADLEIHRRSEFLSPAYYTSMGFAVPAAVGAQINKPKLRPMVFVGDGAFQMTGQELSTVVRCGLNPIVFVLNNKGYTTERLILDGPFNDIHDWAYHRWPEIVRAGWGCEVHTEGDLEQALEKALANTQEFSIINVHIQPLDHSEALDRLGKRIHSQVARAARKRA